MKNETAQHTPGPKKVRRWVNNPDSPTGEEYKLVDLTAKPKEDKEPKNLIREWNWMKSNRSNLWHVETADTRETIVSTPKGYLAQFIASAPDLLKERDELKEQLKAAKVAFDKEVTQYDKEWSSHKATQSLNAELLEALKDSQAVIDFGTNCYRINSKLIAKAEGNG